MRGSRSTEPTALHERSSRRCFVVGNVEKLIKLGDFENLLDLRVDRAQLKLNLELAGLFIDLNQLTEHRRRHELHIAEVEDNALFGRFVQHLGEIAAELLELRFIENAGIVENDRKDLKTIVRMPSLL
jgi:hypothetical protein